MTELVTPRLLLRDFRLADEAAVHAYASDPKTTVFTDWGPNDTAATREFIVQATAEAHSPDRRTYTLAAVLRATDDVIGAAGLVVDEVATRSCSIGYVIHAAFWSRGYATEAAARLLQFGFTDVRLHRIWAGQPALGAGAREGRDATGRPAPRPHPDPRAMARLPGLRGHQPVLSDHPVLPRIVHSCRGSIGAIA